MRGFLPKLLNSNDERESTRLTAGGKIHLRDATEDELRCRQQIEARYEPAVISQAQVDPTREGRHFAGRLITNQVGEEGAFGTQNIGFPILRRPETYRRTMCEQTEFDGIPAMTSNTTLFCFHLESIYDTATEWGFAWLRLSLTTTRISSMGISKLVQLMHNA